MSCLGTAPPGPGLDARRIWQAGVDAVRSDHLVGHAVRVDDTRVFFQDHAIDRDAFDRICVVGGGKAAAAMARGLDQSLAALPQPRFGWVNVPEDCLVPIGSAIHLHPARPAGVNQPTRAAVQGTARILEMVANLGPRDLCIVLIAGGGSALLTAPVQGVSLEEKREVTQLLGDHGADIHQLNTVRKQLSRIKGGGLAAQCRAGHMVSLIISDVLGDPLDVIASGPTVPNTTTAKDALAVLDTVIPGSVAIPAGVRKHLDLCLGDAPSSLRNWKDQATDLGQTHTILLANNATAIAACREEAIKRGYHVIVLPTDHREGLAEHVAVAMLKQIERLQNETQVSSSKRLCILSGGEPVVQLAPESLRGKGGRNQQFVLAALHHLRSVNWAGPSMALLSGGTDGEDGPTDAAGALLWPDLIDAVRETGLNTQGYLERNDAYSLFAALRALLVTGPTQTNVCDVRVVVTDPQRAGAADR